jgi:hypothetical protein
MKRLARTLLVGAVVVASSLPADAQVVTSYQGYQRNGNNGRANYAAFYSIDPARGARRTDPVYISPGTLGVSGGVNTSLFYNIGARPSWGLYLKDPGDGVYSHKDGARVQDIVGTNELRAQRQYSEMMQQQTQMIMRQRQNTYNVQQGNFYMPGSNGGTVNNGSAVAGYASYK